ncbi:S8 family serine peptidase, partial [Patescibacteria group bacterium]|nr:S8 family serine peptidase [Patescibacteria group bacterium]
MRYALISSGAPVQDIEDVCVQVGAQNIRVATLLSQVFCDLDDDQLDTLVDTELDAVIKEIGVVTAGSRASTISPPLIPPPEGPSYTIDQLVRAAEYNLIREAFNPILTGASSTVAVLDTGIDGDHETLKSAVVYEKNFSGASTTNDVFDHGTGVAYVIAGRGRVPGVAPGASLWNIKVLDDEGNGTEENVVLGLDHVLQLRQEAIRFGYPIGHPMRPNVINMSLGAEDDGDPDNPLRVACRQCTAMGLMPIVAAGNTGPEPGTMLSPAIEPEVLAVGVANVSPFNTWYYSARGPTLEGTVKPDIVCMGVNVIVASSGGVSEYKIKTGTSFSAPMISGLVALSMEIPTRFSSDDEIQDAIEEDWLNWVIGNTLKPSGSPPGTPITFDALALMMPITGFSS